MFVETWLQDFPGDVFYHLHAHHYMAHHLSATMSCAPTMRDHHSILVLLEDRWHGSSIQQHCRDFGEYVKLDLQDAFRLVAVYQYSHNTTWAYDGTLLLFQNANTMMPTLWVGDLNWQLLHPTTGDLLVPITDYT